MWLELSAMSPNSARPHLDSEAEGEPGQATTEGRGSGIVLASPVPGRVGATAVGLTTGSRRSALSSRHVLGIGIVGGALSGLLGVGGGTVMVPLLVLWAAVPQRDAHAISLGAIIPISIVGVLTYGIAGEIRPGDAVALAIGSMVGARVGAGLLVRASDRTLKLGFGVFLLAVAVTMVSVR